MSSGVERNLVLGLAHEQFFRYPEEVPVGEALGSAFQITYSDRRQLGGGHFAVYLARPRTRIQERFGMGDEVLVLKQLPGRFSLNRAVDLIDIVLTEMHTRVDPVAVIFIGEEESLEEDLAEFLSGKGEPGQRTIVPVVESMLIGDKSGEYLLGALTNHLHAQDLFAIESPIRADSYFFGREKVVNRMSTELRLGVGVQRYGTLLGG